MIRLSIMAVGFVLFIAAVCGIDTNESQTWFYEAYFGSTVGIAIMYVGYKFPDTEEVKAEIEAYGDMPVHNETHQTLCSYPTVNPYTRRVPRG